jgi:hypothetical protein
LRVRTTCLSVLVAVVASGSMASAASAWYSDPFSCSYGPRSIAAQALFSGPTATTWYVNHINYQYSNSGNGQTNTFFRLYNGSNTMVWNWPTPDDRHDGVYSQPVKVYLSRGPNARPWQTTYFDVVGPDPACTGQGRF